MELTDQQKNKLLENFNSTPNLTELTRLVFEDETLDGRTKEGRAVRDFLASRSLDYETTAWEKVKEVDLSEREVEFIKVQAENGLSAFQISEILYPDINVKRLSKHHLAVLEFLKEYEPNFVHESESAINQEYKPPKTITISIDKINKYCHLNHKEEEMNHEDLECAKQLLKNLSAPRLIQVINNYSSKKDRELFEAEFVRAIWDKPDLTSDEVNLYINVCVDYINLKNISSHIEKLNTMFNEVEDQQDMTVRLAEVLKSKTDEYDKCEKRMESLIKKLNGDRAERLRNRQKENASILTLVRNFQIEEQRNQMIEIAEMQKKLVEEEADRLDNMESWKARILGISKKDAI
ncbi:MAG: hypothetical protein CMK23_06105 [Porticoccaceae bacterium]|nr:hypothetical protein [Porticoccaceae bacterium]